MNTVWQDLRYGLRTLLKKPGFTAVAVITLALGIGANTAIFSVMNAILLRPLPYPKADQLVVLWAAAPERGASKNPVSALDFDDWRTQNRGFESLAAFPASDTTGLTLTGQGMPEQLSTAYVSADFFALLGVNATLGRVLLPNDHEAGRNQVVVLSHGFWLRHFGANPDVVGKTLTLDGKGFRVVGVMPSKVDLPSSDTDVWAPLSLIGPDRVPHVRGVRWLTVMGRLRSGVTIEQARAEMTTIVGRLESEYPDSNRGLNSITVKPLQEHLVGNVRTAILVIFAAVGFVLLIACANIANLLLARFDGRYHEMAIRTAVGASRLRLMRQIHTESVLLSMMGGTLGLMLAVGGTKLMLWLSPANIPRLTETGIDIRMLTFTLIVSVMAGLIFGLAPALKLTGVDPNESLKEGGRQPANSSRRELRSVLVVAEVALAVVLVIGSMLMIKSLYRLLQVNPGFNPENVLTMQINVPTYRAPQRAQYVAFLEDALSRIEKVPGVQTVGMVRPLPLKSPGETVSFSVEGQPAAPPGQEPEAALRMISPNYFRAMGITLIAGRDFSTQDKEGSQPVAIITQSVAKKFFSDRDPVGRSVNLAGVARVIVGVASDLRERGLNLDPVPAIYVPHSQVPRRGMTVVVRTSINPINLVGAIRSAIWEVNKDQPIIEIETMEQEISTSIAQPRFSTALLGIFAGLALILAAVGIYGVTSHTVSQRTHEIGIRMALGAQTREVLKLVVGRGTVLIMIGIVIGMAGALALTRLMKSLLFSVSATDPLTFVVVGSLLAAVGLLACYLPARRATKVDPLVALRYE